ncbi:MAG TPA: hypothetical protein VNV18_19245 [Stellaceae bacterium]|nr:hypothetical protein [Stellaceae bacterium]
MLNFAGREAARRYGLLLLRLGLAAVIVAVAGTGAAAPPDTVNAVRTGGWGVLTKHIDWLVTSSRRTYHHIRLPSRIAVGDTVRITFGSSPKTYGFSVAWITLNGNRCKLFSKSEIQNHRDRITVTPCYAADDEQTLPGGRQ